MTHQTLDDLMDIEQVRKHFSYKNRSSVYDLQARDATFPIAIKLGRSNYWLKEEIMTWEKERISRALEMRKSYGVSKPHG